MEDEYIAKIREAADFIKSQIGTDSVDIGVMVGTALKSFAQALNGKEIPYEEIPHFPHMTTSNKKGKVIYTEIADKKTLCFSGRFEYCDGLPLSEVTMPVRILKELLAGSLIITSPAASLRKELKPGMILTIKDHINCMGVNPLIGQNIDEHGKKFVNMSRPYSTRLNNLLDSTSHVQLSKGTFIAVTGPNLETPAEARYYRAIGGAAIGMSVVPEVIVANHCSIETIGLCNISNYAPNVKEKGLSKEEIVETARKTEKDLVSVILNLIGVM